MDVFECYTRDQLRDFLVGNLPDDTIDRISQHLDECNVCEETVVGLDGSDDTLIKHLAGGIQADGFDVSHDDAVDNDPHFKAAFEQIVGDANNLAQISQLVGKTKDTLQPKQIGDYQIVETLARGGMGSVFKARHMRLEKMVAIKILPERKMRNVDAIARFAREMKIIGQMSHPSMVGATDAGEDQGTHYLVMELVDGMDLGQMIRNCGPLRIPDACELMRQAALGLEYAHSQNVIHRDVKPSNLMLGRDKTVKVLDLGLATLSSLNGTVDELTTVGQMMGTLDYMAPEQSGSDHPVDHRSDVYGLAATLYKLLTGTAPYSHPDLSTPLKKLRAMATNDPTPVQNRNPEIPESLAKIIDDCLNRDPAKRLQTGAELAAQLMPFCDGHNLGALLERAEVIAESKVKNASQTEQDLVLDLGLKSVGKQLLEKGNLLQTQTAGSRGWFSNFFRIAGMLGGAGLLIWASITIYINTMSGQLVIESDIEDIKVTVLHEEKPTRDLSIEHGTESTRLFAGKYRVEINGPSDGLVINNGVFELRRGETVVTKITRKKIADSKTAANAEPSRLSSKMPVTSSADSIEQYRQRIIELELEWNRLADRLGSNHPRRQEIQLQISMLQQVVSQLEMETKPYLKKYKISGDLRLAQRVAQTMLDGRTGVRIEQDSDQFALIVLGNKADHQIVADTISALETRQSAVPPASDDKPFLKTYASTGDIESAFKTLQTMLVGNSGIRMEQNKVSNTITLFADKADHELAAEIMALLEKGANHSDATSQPIGNEDPSKTIKSAKRNIGDISNLTPQEALAASQAVRTLVQATKHYKLATGRNPKTLNDLVQRPVEMKNSTWGGPYLESIPLDPWGTPYRLHPQLSENRPMIQSAGADKVWETGDEITQTYDAKRATMTVNQGQASQPNPTFDGIGLERWADDYISMRNKNAMIRIRLLAQKSTPELVEQIIQSKLERAKNELSENHQYRVIRVVTELSTTNDQRSRLLDYIRDYQLQTLESEIELDLWSEPLTKWTDETRNYLLALVNSKNENHVLVAVNSLKLVYRSVRNSSSDSSAERLDPRWLQSLHSIIESKRFADQPNIETAVFETILRNVPIGEKTIRLLEDVIASDKPVELKSLAATALLRHQPASNKLVPLVLELVETADFGPASLMELVPVNELALPTIEKCLKDPKWGNANPQGVRGANNNPGGAAALIGGLGSSGGNFLGGAISGRVSSKAAREPLALRNATTRAGLIYSIGERFKNEESSRSQIKTLIPLLRNELNRSEEKSVLEQTWYALEKITGEPTPPIFEGRTMDFWLGKLGKQNAISDRLLATKAIGRLGKNSDNLNQVVLSIFQNVKDLSFDDLEGSPETPELELAGEVVGLFKPTVYSNNRATRNLRQSRLKTPLLESLDEIAESDAMLALHAIRELKISGNDRNSDAVIRFGIRLAKSDNELIRRRAYRILLTAETGRGGNRSGVAEYHGNFVKQAMESDKNDDLFKLALLDAISSSENRQSGGSVSWGHSTTPIVQIAASKDPRTLMTMLSLANTHGQRNHHMFSLVFTTLADKPDFLNEKHQAYQVNLWSPVTQSTSADSKHKTVFEQLVEFLDMSKIPLDPNRIKSNHLEHYRPNLKLAKEGDGWESVKLTAYEYMKSRLDHELDPRIKTKLKRILTRLEPILN